MNLSLFGKVIDQLGDPGIRRPLLLGFFLSLIVFTALWFASGAFLMSAASSFPAWAQWVVGVLGAFSAVYLTILIFPGLMIALSSFFLEGVVEAVEKKHYPTLEKARRPSFSESLFQSIRLVLVLLVLNVLCLPLYFFPGLNIVAFLLVNGYCLGRESFELVASRRMDPIAAKAMRSAHSNEILMIGVGFTALTLVPLLGFFIPVLITATMTHCFHFWRGNART